MRSSARTRANRRNAQRSTGPRTPEGKAKVACNARKHGLAAARRPDDAGALIDALADALRQEGLGREAYPLACAMADSMRVRQVRAAIDSSSMQRDASEQIRHMERLDRYERRASASVRKLADAVQRLRGAQARKDADS